MNAPRRAAVAVSLLVYLGALAVPVILALAVVGSSPALLGRIVPPEYRDAVAAFSAGAATLTGQGGGPALLTEDAGAAGRVSPGAAVRYQGEWSPRRIDDHPPPTDLARDIDFAVELSDGTYIPHWPCEQDIPVRSFDAPPNSEPDLAWAVETLASASGLPLRYDGPGSPQVRDGRGAISVSYGDHPMFDDPDIAGVGGPAVWPQGLILQGSVTLRPDQVSPLPGDEWTRALTLHELMHAVGVDHAAQHRREIMAERPGPNPQMNLGHGDRFALQLVGCH